MISHKRFEVNALGKDYAVGDIHGCFSKLKAKLDAIGFNPEVDRLFSTGDLVDRGAESHLAEEWIFLPWFHAVRGNHDDMARRFPNGNMDALNYIRNGGMWNISRLPHEQRITADAMETLPLVIEVETMTGIVGILHAECVYAKWNDLIEQVKSRPKHIEDSIMWARNRITDSDTSVIDGIRAVIVGHTPVLSHTLLGNVHYIDTGAVFGRDFTILDLETLLPV
jgi:serine/threonine protein phosphatase 1